MRSGITAAKAHLLLKKSNKEQQEKPWWLRACPQLFPRMPAAIPISQLHQILLNQTSAIFLSSFHLICL